MRASFHFLLVGRMGLIAMTLGVGRWQLLETGVHLERAAIASRGEAAGFRSGDRVEPTSGDALLADHLDGPGIDPPYDAGATRGDDHPAVRLPREIERRRW